VIFEARGRLDQEQIGGFDVPMDDLGGCRVRKTSSRLPH
jgi:hypothetical protein